MQGRFADSCRAACANQGWELLPTGVLVLLGDGRRQLVSIEFFEYQEEELVRLWSATGPVSALSREQLATALDSNMHLAHGALAIKDDDLCLVDTLPGDADENDVAACIEFLARSADEYERVVFGTDVN